MANWDIIKAAITSTIKANGNEEITGASLQRIFLSLINALGENATFVGTARPNENLITVSDGPVFYIATEAGNYSNGLALTEGEVAIFEYSGGTWQKQSLNIAAESKYSNIYRGDLGDLSGISGNDFISSIRSKIEELTGSSLTEGRYTFKISNATKKQELIYGSYGGTQVITIIGNLRAEVLNNKEISINKIVSTNPTVVECSLTSDILGLPRFTWYHRELPIVDDFEGWEEYFFDDFESASSFSNKTYSAAQIISIGQALAKRIADIAIDVTSLFTVGGTLKASSSKVRSSYLYHANDTFFSSVTLAVGSNTWIFDAYHPVNTDGEWVLRKVRAFAGYSDGIFTCTEVKTIIESNNTENVTTPAGLAGKLNLTDISAIKEAQSKLSATNEIAYYIITDSQGKLPSTESAYRVSEANAKQLQVTSPNALTQAVLALATSGVTISAFGVNVGDLIALTRVKVAVEDLTAALGISLSLSGEIELYQYKILNTNDAKPYNYNNIAEGVMGLMSPWDKAEVNKIRGIETTANNALPKTDRLPTIEGNEFNMDECLQNGVYPWCATGRPPGSTGHYSLVVSRSSTTDFNLFYTVEQTAFGREGDTGKVFKRIIFVKNDGTKEFGSWIDISGQTQMPKTVITLSNIFTSIGYEPISLSEVSKEDLLKGFIYVDSVELKNRCTIAYDDYTDVVYIANRVSADTIRLSEITNGLVTNCGFYNYKTGAAVTPSQMTTDEIKEIAKYYPSLQIPV